MARPPWGSPAAARPGSARRNARRLLVALGGQARAAEPELPDVVHAPASGDDVLAPHCTPGVLLVTVDRELRARAEAAGAEVVGPGWLLARV